MAKMKQYEQHAALTQAFAMADANTPKDKQGNGSYGFAKASGMPRSAAQMQASKKAAQTSARNRHARAEVNKANATAPDLGQTETTSTGGLGLNKPKGLLVKKNFGL